MEEVAVEAVLVDGGQGEIRRAFDRGARLEVIGELQQVVAVGGDGIRRQTALLQQVRQELLDALVH